ncbi:helix-turn-helix domain-containing protein [Microbacterium sp. NPDC057659]|uniref:helix-turn-helix domain-containing protein n=1 Tax=Microbacterium sp. NPDC057659 TaxID=3346198 RepID=UPI003672B44E
MLDPIGLDELQVAAYRALLRVPSATVDEVAVAARLTRERALQVLGALEEQGLVARRAADAGRYVASPPGLSLGPRLDEQKHRLAQAQETLESLAELYREGAAHRVAPDVVDVVVGADALRQRVFQVQSSADARIDVFILSDVAVVSAEENEAEAEALARGVRYRVLVEPDVVARPGFIEAARSVVSHGEEIRVLSGLPTRLIIADGRLALLPMFSQADEGVIGGLLVRPSGLLDLVNGMFERCWEAATHLIDDDTNTLAREHGIDRELLSMLLLGMTDPAIADQLGVSARTVQRRIAELMESAGVSTRIQLGAAAVRLGWA